MAGVKEIICKVIPSNVAIPFVKAHHYSGKVCTNSQLHIGAFLNNQLHGVMSFGPSMDKSKIQPLVKGTKWNEFIELNRMAFDSALPKNSESRCLGQAIRMIKRNAPHIKWIISFADGCQCGDGTIYRASNFKLTGITPNKTILEFPDGSRHAALTLESCFDGPACRKLCKDMGVPVKYRTRAEWVKLGARFVPGFMFRYIYFIDKDCEKNLTVPVLPFSKIDEVNGRMYRGIPLNCGDSNHESRDKCCSGTSDDQSGRGGAIPTIPHHSSPISDDSSG